KGELQLLAERTERRAQGIDRVHTLALIGIALVDIFLRQTMEGGDDNLRLEVELREMGANGVCERLDIDGVFRVRRHRTQRRLKPHGLKLVEDLVVDRR